MNDKKRTNKRILTARYFLKMYDFSMCPHRRTGSEVAVDVAFLGPGVIIPSEAGRGLGAGLLTGLQGLELVKQLGAPRYEEPSLDGNDLA